MSDLIHMTEAYDVGASDPLTLPIGHYWGRISSVAWGEARIQINDTLEPTMWVDFPDFDFTKNSVFVLPGNANYRILAASVDEPITLEAFEYARSSDWTEVQRNRIIELLRLDQEPFVPGPVVVPPPTSALMCNCVSVVIDEATGDPLNGVKVYYLLKSGPGTAGRIYRPRVQSQVSATISESDGVVIMPMLQGGEYIIWANKSTIGEVRFTVPNDESANIPEIVARRT